TAVVKRDSTLAIRTMISSGFSEDPPNVSHSSFRILLTAILRANGVSISSVGLEDVYVIFTDLASLPSVLWDSRIICFSGDVADVIIDLIRNQSETQLTGHRRKTRAGIFNDLDSLKFTDKVPWQLGLNANAEALNKYNQETFLFLCFLPVHIEACVAATGFLDEAIEVHEAYLLSQKDMEAWSVKGINALASSIGKPVIMDEVTTKMCVTGVGRIGFARVLVEIDAEKGNKGKIEIMYKSKNVAERTKEIVNIEYSWIPCICSHCKVFDHTDSYCKVKSKNMIDAGIVKDFFTKSKVEWLKEGDRNTTYFHKSIKEMVHRGRIMTVRNEEGIRFEKEDVAVQIVKHFEEFLGKRRPVQKLSCRRLKGTRSRWLYFKVLQISLEHSWERSVSREFFFTGKLLGEVSATIISLVLKIPTPDKVSDFIPSCNKSTVFFEGLSSVEQNNILNIIPFTVGKLLVSFMQNYWASVFLLPKQVIYEINKLLKGFLWCQGDLTKGKAKIFMEKLKGRSIWEVQCDSNSSVGWKNILNLRDKARDHIWWKIGNGISVNVWHDKWCFVGPLSEFIETRDVYDAILNNNWTVSEIIREGRWMWLEEWNNDFERLRQVQVPVLNDEKEDNALWVSSLGQEQHFKIRNVWKDMNYNNTKVNWFSRFAQSIPRHTFVTWLAIQKRLMTQDKLMIWRPNDDLKCALCNKRPNSHNHLFFTCEFSNGIWNELLTMLNVRLSRCWDQIISEIKALPSNKNI
ncbi:RNA-directed DNA polymerase, eukaryota, reverse transcriptase zinc-binding domain protein, partial [Tanacetum coccineum]